MTARNTIASLVFVLLAVLLVLGSGSTAGANDDFTLRILINDKDISGKETIIVDPEKGMEIDLRITNGDRAMKLNALSVAIVFADRVIMTQREPLLNFQMAPGEVHSERIVIDIEDTLKIGDQAIMTGIYRSRFSLEYTLAGVEEVWDQVQDIKIPGNPLTTPAGAAGAAVSIGTVAAIIALVKSIAVPGLAAGSVLPTGASVRAIPGLYEFLTARLESTTRGRVVGSIVNSAKKRIVKQKCPMCESRIKHGYCFTCGKSAKEIRNEYVNSLKELALQCGQLISSDRTTTVEEICSRLDISDKVATDVVATLKHAKMVKVKGVARKITGKAVTAGICSGISAIIWITVGGFAVLSTTALITILIVAIVVPFTVAKSLQMKARHAIMRNTN